MTSFSNKLDICYDLAVSLAYENDMKTVIDMDKLYGKDASDLIWGYVDGLIHKHHHRRMTGQCSLNDFISYDPDVEEQYLDLHIKQFQELLCQRV